MHLSMRSLAASSVETCHTDVAGSFAGQPYLLCVTLMSNLWCVHISSVHCLVRVLAGRGRLAPERVERPLAQS